MIVLWQPTREHNVRQAARNASAFGETELFYTGDRLAPSPPEVHCDCGFVEPIRYDAILDLARREKVPIIAVDRTESATPLAEFKHPPNACYVFGPEDGFVPPRMYDDVIYIPTGLALNLATTVAVVLYDKESKK